jgi:hypothetical protein
MMKFDNYLQFVRPVATRFLIQMTVSSFACGPPFWGMLLRHEIACPRSTGSAKEKTKVSQHLYLHLSVFESFSRTRWNSKREKDWILDQLGSS